MPRIDPNQLLKCLSVLLSSNGGIRSKDEVQRLASLMTKFSKKLVSKCIYILILKTTDADLLDMFMTAGGWDLTFNWLSDGIQSRNWPLVVELVELLLLCPVDIERLKGNNCPKLIKLLSKDVNATEKVRMLACNVVEQWLAVVKAVAPQAALSSGSNGGGSSSSILHPEMIEMNHEEMLNTVVNKTQFNNNSTNNVSGSGNNSSGSVTSSVASPSQSGGGKHHEQAPLDHNIPVYKITIRDGKKVLAEVISSDRNNVPQVDNVIEANEDDEDEEEEMDDEDEDGQNDNLLQQSNTESMNNTSSMDDDNHHAPHHGKEIVIESTPLNNDQETGQPLKKGVRKTSRTSSEDSITKSDSAHNKRLSETNKKSAIQKKRAGEKRAASPPDFDQKTSKSNKEKKKHISPDKKPKLDVKSKDKHHNNSNKSEKQLQEEKDRAVLSKLITPSLDGIGKIPKKSDKKKSGDQKKVSPVDIKKPPPPKDPKKYNISIETRKGGEERPKTVKTFNSKFRSTGLEELPPPPKAKKSTTTTAAAAAAASITTISFGFDKKEHEQNSTDDKKSLKRTSPAKDVHIPDKKTKEKDEEKEKSDKPEKSTPAKPKPLGLQESDVFADALTAANPVKDVKKRKRRISNTTTTTSTTTTTNTTTTTTVTTLTINESKDNKKAVGSLSPTKNDEIKDATAKPVFKFYQDTLITSEEKKSEEKKKEDIKDNEAEVVVKKPVENYAELEDTFSKEELEDEVSKAEEIITEALKLEDKKNAEREKNRIPKGVLVYVKKRKVVKKSVQWKPDKELETVRYFELDETERVNVTKTFTDMKQMEMINERMLFSRKLAADDVMEEKTIWRPLIPIDIEGDLVVSPGKSSIEKDIQAARERTTLQAIYFNRAMIPDSPAEPDLEIHAMTEPAIIPLDDQSGNSDSVISYKDRPWPEPKGYPPGTNQSRLPESPPLIQPLDMATDQPPMMMQPGPAAPGPFPPGGGVGVGGPPFGHGPPIPFQMPPNMMPPPNAVGGPPTGPPPEWMAGPDGGSMMGAGPPPGQPMPPPNMPPGMMLGPPEMFGAPGGPMPPPEFMGGPPPPQFMGPPHPGMFGPPPPNFGPNNGPPHLQNDMRPPRPWFNNNSNNNSNSNNNNNNNRTNNSGGGNNNGGGGTWRHPSKGGGGGGGNNWKSRATCKFLLRKGYCPVNKCQFNHNPKNNKR